MNEKIMEMKEKLNVPDFQQNSPWNYATFMVSKISFIFKIHSDTNKEIAKSRREELVEMFSYIENYIKEYNLKEDLTMTKEALRQQLKECGIELTNTQFKKTKRDELICMVKEAQATKIDEVKINLKPATEYMVEWLEVHDELPSKDQEAVSRHFETEQEAWDFADHFNQEEDKSWFSDVTVYRIERTKDGTSFIELTRGNKVPVGDMSEDKYYPEEQTEQSVMLKNFKGIDNAHKKVIIDAIVKKSFICTKEDSDSKGMRIITMRKLFGIIKGAYGNGQDVPKDLIYRVINILVHNKYLCFKKYEEGGMVFYPTKKCLEQ